LIGQIVAYRSEIYDQKAYLSGFDKQMFQAKFNLGKLIIYLFNSGLNQGRIRLFLVISCVFKAL